MSASVSPSARDPSAFIRASRTNTRIHMQAHALGPSVLSQSERDAFDAEYYRYYSSLLFVRRISHATSSFVEAPRTIVVVF